MNQQIAIKPELGADVALSVEPTGDPMFDLMQRALCDPSVDADKLGKVLELANRQRDRDREIAREDDALAAKRAFMRAFKNVKSELPQVVKDARNSQTSSDYATAEKLDAAITPIMTKYGFFISFVEGNKPRDESRMHIIGVLGHEGGHEREYPVQVPIAGVGMKGNRMMTSTHGYGATKTYGRRYTKLDIWDIAVMDKDSDGNVNNQVEVSFDTTPWTQRMLEATDMKAMQSITEDLKAEKDVPENALKMLRSAWAGRAKEIGKPNAA